MTRPISNASREALYYRSAGNWYEQPAQVVFLRRSRSAPVSLILQLRSLVNGCSRVALSAWSSIQSWMGMARAVNGLLTAHSRRLSQVGKIHHMLTDSITSSRKKRLGQIYGLGGVLLVFVG